MARYKSNMHPGWTCFLAAFASGMFSIAALLFAVRWLQGWDRATSTIIVAVIAVVLFLIGGSKAEKLREGPPHD